MTLRYLLPSLDCFRTPSLRVQKLSTFFTTVLPTDGDRREGRLDDADAGFVLVYGALMANGGEVGDVWVDILVIVRCPRANIVDQKSLGPH